MGDANPRYCTVLVRLTLLSINFRTVTAQAHEIWSTAQMIWETRFRSLDLIWVTRSRSCDLYLVDQTSDVIWVSVGVTYTRSDPMIWSGRPDPDHVICIWSTRWWDSIWYGAVTLVIPTNQRSEWISELGMKNQFFHDLWPLTPKPTSPFSPH